jgi:hypothetical protein
LCKAQDALWDQLRGIFTMLMGILVIPHISGWFHIYLFWPGEILHSYFLSNLENFLHIHFGYVGLTIHWVPCPDWEFLFQSDLIGLRFQFHDSWLSASRATACWTTAYMIIRENRLPGEDEALLVGMDTPSPRSGCR